jgi:hypothetical protein
MPEHDELVTERVKRLDAFREASERFPEAHDAFLAAAVARVGTVTPSD